MTFQEIDNLFGLTNLTDFVNHLTIEGCQKDALSIFYGTPLLSDEDKWKYQGLNWDWNIYGTLSDFIRRVQQSLNDIWSWIIGIKDFLWNAIGRGWRQWWDEIWEAIRRMYYNFSQEFFKFTQDPWGYIHRIVTNAVSGLIQGIKTIGIDIWDFVQKVQSAVSNVVSGFVDSAKNTIVNFITDRINAVSSWINGVKTTLTNFWNDVLSRISNLWNNFYTWLINVKNDLTGNLLKVKDDLAKTFDFGLGGLADSLLKGFGGLFDKFWDWFKGIISSAWGFVNKNFLLPLKAGAEEIMNWIWDLIQSQIKSLISVAQKIIPRAPEEGASMIWEGLGFLGMGAGILALMCLGGGLAKRVSGADIPYLGGIIADFSGFKYITGAIMGGLVTAAYAQPLKYYYNALFQPYLPDFRDVFDAFSRNIIGPNTFKFFHKYHGVPEKYFYIYEALASDRVSPMLLRTIAEAEILDPEKFFYYVMDNGYDPAKSAYITSALAYRAVSPIIRAAEAAIFKNEKEGFISSETRKKEIANLRSRIQKPVTFVGADGTRYGAVLSLPLPSETLQSIQAHWESYYDSMMDKVGALKTAFSKESITESEFRSELSKLGIVPNRIEDIVAREKAKKKGKTEPDKGKDLRKELKTVLKDCYKEGLITKERLDKEVKEANKLVDEETLIFQRAEWEAFKDDMLDLRDIYKESLANGLITEAEFRRDLIDMGFRPDKVELMIRYDTAKKLGRLAKKTK